MSRPVPERLEDQLRGFTAHVRDPATHPAPADVPERRMGVYRDLMFNNVSGFLAGSFPVLHEVLGEADWTALVRDYFRDHRARTPLFPEMPREFLDYLCDERAPSPADPPFLRELAHYEWVELALALDEAEADDDGFDAGGDLLDGVPAISPLVWSLTYAYPVHRIGPDYQPGEPPAEPTCLIVYRDRRDDVGFLATNPATHALVEALRANTGRTGRALLEELAVDMGHADPTVVVEGGRAILEDLRDRDIVLGSRPVRGEW